MKYVEIAMVGVTVKHDPHDVDAGEEGQRCTGQQESFHGYSHDWKVIHLVARRPRFRGRRAVLESEGEIDPEGAGAPQGPSVHHGDTREVVQRARTIGGSGIALDSVHAISAG